MDADDMNQFIAAVDMMLGQSAERKYNRNGFEYQMKKDGLQKGKNINQEKKQRLLIRFLFT